MRNRTGRLWCAAAVGALTAAAVPSAYAASAGEAPVPLARSWTAKLLPGSTAEFRLPGGAVTCDTSTASGADYAIAQAAWTCTGPLGMTGQATLSGGAAFSPQSSSGGVQQGVVPGFRVSLAFDSILGTCTAVISGALGNASFDETTSRFAVTNGTGIRVASASGCAGLINTGDPAGFQGQYQVTFLQ
ncbi:hypothetical protein ACFVWY_15985 [Streptomyces sp. NPDC058195]|uniref:hypothetical protein n=1 Tax=Streptomyces sp. NPDC058195 TaxID=3346375 RepID=UPI0036E8790B